jgi:hypothetical protein
LSSGQETTAGDSSVSRASDDVPMEGSVVVDKASKSAKKRKMDKNDEDCTKKKVQKR